MIFRAIVAVALLISATEAAEGNVKFWINEVTLHCPGNPTDWAQVAGNKADNTTEDKTYTYTYSDNSKDQFTCNYGSGGDSGEYQFYIQGKACKHDCFELDGILFAVVIVADVLGTAVVMFIVYKCTNKKSAGPRHAPKGPHSRTENTADLNADYYPLNPNTRSEVYSDVRSG
ncbi:hypothetical protein WMY93_029307 [Mugilogobius chulae]|uniref:CD3 gamma/delta subunit Ig-like domain-containing protein n=1 Tax=Mugilogobius chulae TaxID=88201 RepID=A0AAW0MQX6_9GOBI